MSLEVCNVCLFLFSASLPLQIKELIDTYLEVNVAISKCQFAQAITMLDTLRSQSIFGSNELFTVMIAQCYYYNGEHDIALTHLQRAQANNFFILDGLSKCFPDGFCTRRLFILIQILNF